MDKPAILATLDIQDIGRKQTNIKKTNLIKILVIVATSSTCYHKLTYPFVGYNAIFFGKSRSGMSVFTNPTCG
jgi:hypothetical protein